MSNSRYLLICPIYCYLPHCEYGKSSLIIHYMSMTTPAFISYIMWVRQVDAHHSLYEYGNAYAHPYFFVWFIIWVRQRLRSCLLYHYMSTYINFAHLSLYGYGIAYAHSCYMIHYMSTATPTLMSTLPLYEYINFAHLSLYGYRSPTPIPAFLDVLVYNNPTLALS